MGAGLYGRRLGRRESRLLRIKNLLRIHEQVLFLTTDSLKHVDGDETVASESRTPFSRTFFGRACCGKHGRVGGIISDAWIRKQLLTGRALIPLKAQWPDHDLQDVPAAAAHR